MQAAGMKIVAVQSGEWEMEKANTVAANLLTRASRPQGAAVRQRQHGDRRRGGGRAAGRTQQVLVAGFDDIAAIKPLLADGRVVATADQHADQLAVFGIDLALQALKDGKPAADRATAGRSRNALRRAPGPARAHPPGRSSDLIVLLAVWGGLSCCLAR